MMRKNSNVIGVPGMLRAPYITRVLSLGFDNQQAPQPDGLRTTEKPAMYTRHTDTLRRAFAAPARSAARVFVTHCLTTSLLVTATGVFAAMETQENTAPMGTESIASPYH